MYTDWEMGLGDMLVGKGVWGCRLGQWGCMQVGKGVLGVYEDWERSCGGIKIGKGIGGCMQVGRQTEARRGGGGRGRPLWTLQQNLVGCCLFLHLSPPGDRR